MCEGYHSTGWSHTFTQLLLSLIALQLCTETEHDFTRKRFLQLRQWKETHKIRNSSICWHFAEFLKVKRLICANISLKLSHLIHPTYHLKCTKWVKLLSGVTFFLSGEKADKHHEHKFCVGERRCDSPSMQLCWQNSVLAQIRSLEVIKTWILHIITYTFNFACWCVFAFLSEFSLPWLFSHLPFSSWLQILTKSKLN